MIEPSISNPRFQIKKEVINNEMKPVIVSTASPISVLSSLTDSDERSTSNEAKDCDRGTTGEEGKGRDLLAAHGITMLPVDDNDLLSSVVDSGHNVSLTEAGKLALGTFNKRKSEENEGSPVKKINITPEFLNAISEKLGVKKVTLKPVPPHLKYNIGNSNNNNPKVRIIKPASTVVPTPTTSTYKPQLNLDRYKVKLYFNYTLLPPS